MPIAAIGSKSGSSSSKYAGFVICWGFHIIASSLIYIQLHLYNSTKIGYLKDLKHYPVFTKIWTSKTRRETWRASRICSFVWGIGPSGADTTKIPPSISTAPAIMFYNFSISYTILCHGRFKYLSYGMDNANVQQCLGSEKVPREVIPNLIMILSSKP